MIDFLVRLTGKELILIVCRQKTLDRLTNPELKQIIDSLKAEFVKRTTNERAIN